MSAAAILVGAKALISDPEFHTTDTLARDETGRPEDCDSPAACQWCAVGAVNVLIEDENKEHAGKAYHALNRAANCMGAMSGAVLNDSGPHSQVMKMFDLAIKIAREDEA